MKAEIKETVNKMNVQYANEMQEKIDQYYADHREYTNWYNEMSNKFNKWKNEEIEKISQLKIVVPKDLEGIFQKVKSVGSKR